MSAMELSVDLVIYGFESMDKKLQEVVQKVKPTSLLF